jgi:hypothetical protein
VNVDAKTLDELEAGARDEVAAMDAKIFFYPALEREAVKKQIANGRGPQAVLNLVADLREARAALKRIKEIDGSGVDFADEAEALHEAQAIAEAALTPPAGSLPFDPGAFRTQLETAWAEALEKIADHAGDDFNPSQGRRYVNEWTEAEGFTAIQRIARKALGRCQNCNRKDDHEPSYRPEDR